MGDYLKKASKQLNDFWSGLEQSSRIKVIIASILLLIGVIGLTYMINHKEYTVLYSNLDSKDAGEILNKLDEMKVDAKPQGTGTILVPKSQEARIRMQLSSEGYPKSGLNYDLFINNNGFGTTDFEKQKYLLFQLQERLQNTIKTLEGVEDAFVTISMPEQDSFVLQEDKQDTTASILLKLKNNVEIKPSQVNAIKALVMKSVLGLKDEGITIIDQNMNILNTEANRQEMLASNQLDLENQVREQLRKQTLSLLEPVFGLRKVVVAVNVKLDFDKQERETVKFEPVIDDSGIVVSMNELKEKVNNASAEGVPGQDSNGGAPGYPASQQGNGTYDKSNITYNYEVNQIKEKIEKAQGQVKELSVSVIIDNDKLDGETTNKVQQIVAIGMGIDPERVAVQNMKFDDNTNLKDRMEQAMEANRNASRSKMIKEIALYSGIALALLVAVLLIIKSIQRNSRAYRIQEEMLESTPTASLMNTPEIELEVLDDSPVKKQLDKFVQQRPDVVAQLLRTWLSED